ncbi:HEAT repeat domain-containing protein [Ktedonosporobacter rubrisoli]|uniref:HEAT repeat domain-containing protein n=1 Tax=Ktedonosporobacter rubrisoli TaxID=2509675 RepID=A0A4P6JKC7_KTERU|nr:HEAT repeat domain-containing protein [Ktedonosporobacter rubrisoli]QBD75604.1 HEAT repeat domain-containing protein [Ktedonosporobacter rubrisoli]
MDHYKDPSLSFYRRYIEPYLRAQNEAEREQAVRELGEYLGHEYWRSAVKREHFSRELATLGEDKTYALVEVLAAFLETRRGQPDAWPEEDPYEEGPPLPDQQGEAAVLALKMIKSQWRGQSGPSQLAIPALLKVLAGGYQWNVLETAIGTLGESGDERAIGPLLERLAAGDRRAAKALGQLKASDALLTAMQSPREDVQRAAIEALGLGPV